MWKCIGSAGNSIFFVLDKTPVVFNKNIEASWHEVYKKTSIHRFEREMEHLYFLFVGKSLWIAFPPHTIAVEGAWRTTDIM